jgi:hypothetical protein
MRGNNEAEGLRQLAREARQGLATTQAQALVEWAARVSSGGAVQPYLSRDGGRKGWRGQVLEVAGEAGIHIR